MDADLWLIDARCVGGVVVPAGAGAPVMTEPTAADRTAAQALLTRIQFSSMRANNVDMLAAALAAVRVEGFADAADRDVALVQSLQARVAALEAELTNQWEYNHAEHCGQMPNLHPGRCHWPKPAVLTP